jgi:hypothetical protein
LEEEGGRGAGGGETIDVAVWAAVAKVSAEKRRWGKEKGHAAFYGGREKESEAVRRVCNRQHWWVISTNFVRSYNNSVFRVSIEMLYGFGGFES